MEAWVFCIAGALAHVPQLTKLKYVVFVLVVCMSGGDVAPLWRRGFFELLLVPLL